MLLTKYIDNRTNILYNTNIGSILIVVVLKVEIYVLETKFYRKGCVLMEEKRMKLFCSKTKE